MSVSSLRILDKYLFGLLTLAAGPFFRIFASRRMPRAPRRILVIKLWAIGDAVLTLPLIRALRTAHPAAKIDVLCHRANRAVYEDNADIDAIVEFGVVNVLRLARRYDACCDTEPFLNLSAMIAAWSARTRVGFRNRLRWLFYDRTVGCGLDAHAVEKYLEMGAILGAPGRKELVPLPCADGTRRAVGELLAASGVPDAVRPVGFCASVGASVKGRQWPPERFRELARRILRDEADARIVLFGTREDRELNELIRDGDPRIVNLSGMAALKETFCLVAAMRAFVSNDTGPMHIAAAQGVPTLGIFGPSSPVLWAPYGPANAYVGGGGELCGLAPCNVPHQGLVRECRLAGSQRDICIRSISVDEVYGRYRALAARSNTLSCRPS